MSRFIRRVTIIEAEQFYTGPYDVPGVCRGDSECYHRVPHVHTAHGQAVFLEDGDWVIPESDGRGYYPCKDDIFRSTYDPA